MKVWVEVVSLSGISGIIRHKKALKLQSHWKRS